MTPSGRGSAAPVELIGPLGPVDDEDEDDDEIAGIPVDEDEIGTVKLKSVGGPVKIPTIAEAVW